MRGKLVSTSLSARISGVVSANHVDPQGFETGIRHRTRSAFSEQQRHRPGRSPHGHKPSAWMPSEGVRETGSRGCSPPSFYNRPRPHSSPDGSTPDQAYSPRRRSAWQPNSADAPRLDAEILFSNRHQLKPTYLTGLQFSGHLSHRRDGRGPG